MADSLGKKNRLYPIEFVLLDDTMILLLFLAAMYKLSTTLLHVPRSLAESFSSFRLPTKVPKMPSGIQHCDLRRPVAECCIFCNPRSFQHAFCENSMESIHSQCGRIAPGSGHSSTEEG